MKASNYLIAVFALGFLAAVVSGNIGNDGPAGHEKGQTHRRAYLDAKSLPEFDVTMMQRSFSKKPVAPVLESRTESRPQNEHENGAIAVQPIGGESKYSRLLMLLWYSLAWLILMVVAYALFRCLSGVQIAINIQKDFLANYEFLAAEDVGPFSNSWKSQLAAGARIAVGSLHSKKRTSNLQFELAMLTLQGLLFAPVPFLKGEQSSAWMYLLTLMSVVLFLRQFFVRLYRISETACGRLEEKKSKLNREDELRATPRSFMFYADRVIVLCPLMSLGILITGLALAVHTGNENKFFRSTAAAFWLGAFPQLREAPWTILQKFIQRSKENAPYGFEVFGVAASIVLGSFVCIAALVGFVVAVVPKKLLVSVFCHLLGQAAICGTLALVRFDRHERVKLVKDATVSKVKDLKHDIKNMFGIRQTYYY